MDIEPFWTAAGQRSAASCGVPLAEVVGVLDSTSAIYLHTESYDSIWYVDEVRGGVITIICERQSRSVAAYDIALVRPAGPDEIKLWRSKQ